jgi:tetratricopeptide (TPR) repeat protein
MLSAALLFAFAWASPAHAQAPATPQSPLLGVADPAGYQHALDLAEEAAAARDDAAAEPLLESVTAAYALDPRTWSLLGDVKRRLNKPAEAIAAYERAIALAGPRYRFVREWIAELYMQTGDHDGAIRTLEQLVFENAYLQRPGLMSAEVFAPLRADPRFQRVAGVVDTSAMNREQGWRADLDFLLGEIRRLDPRYHRGEDLPERLMAVYRELYDNAGARTDEQMYAGLARLVGALGQNHTMMWGPSFEGARPNMPALHYLPIQYYLFPEGVFIVGGRDASLVGAQLLGVDGVPAAEVLQRVRATQSARTEIEAVWSAPLRLEDVAILNGLGITRRTDRANLRLRLRNGRIVTRTVEAVDTPTLGKLPAPSNVAPPLFLQHVSESHRFEVWTDTATIYAQVNQIAPDPDETLPQFGLRLRAALGDNHTRNLIVDLRHNNGGNTFTYPELLRTAIAFSADSDHRLYVLIGRNTYSAAANLTTELQRLARPIFVGEPTSGIGNQDGDEGQFRLPYSGLYGTITGIWWQLSDPWDERYSQAPQAPVQLTAADYFAGRDPALDAVRAMIAARTQ